MPEVVRGDEPCAGCLREAEERLVVGVEEAWSLWSGKFEAVSGSGDGVQIPIHVIECHSEGSGIAFEDFLVFEEEMIAENQPPFATAELLQNLKGGPTIGKQRGENYV